MNDKEKASEYVPHNIESKWIEYWEKNKTYKTESIKNLDQSKKKMHVLDMFPYPSGEGLHTGHSKIFSASDIYARLKRMQGYNVLHATGWDAFGLPAEQYAIKNKVNPKISTNKNTDNFERQMKTLGLSYDWDRTVNTTDPKFYKWTQWIFKQLYKKGLCYETFEPINWCPSCKTGLANEDLEDGKCERCGSVVEKKPIRQWVVKITEYADRLLEGIDNLDWKESIKEMQRNWIGKNVGVKYKLKVKNTNLEIETYSTHFEAFYADTFAVIAPDHKLLSQIVNGVLNEKEILEFAKKILDKKAKAGFKELEDNEGIFTGRYLVDPITNEDLPLWISSYALSDYGTGIIKCSAHDSRDFAFAKKYNLKLRTVMYPKSGTKEDLDKIKNFDYCYNDFDNAVLEQPNQFINRNPIEAHNEILDYLVKNNFATESTQYKLRDWVFARQRYWGEPFPIVFDENHQSYLVADTELPVVLPDVESYEPTGDGEGPLKSIKEWVEVKGFINKSGEFISEKNYRPGLIKLVLQTFLGVKPVMKTFYRETNTMPQWAGSSWYWLRYLDPQNEKTLVGADEEKYWSSNSHSVDIYLGGMEHATRHLIYGRFWNIFLNDIGVLTHSEPFKRLEAVGLVLGEGGVKMSKRLGNIVNPDDMVNQFGADTLRLYLAFAAPFHDSFAWDTKAIVGPRRFIERVWNLQYKIQPINMLVVGRGEVEVLINQTIKKVGEDYEKLQFNTAVSQMMIFVNAVEKQVGISLDHYKILLKLIAPICPFFTEEVWSRLNGDGGAYQSIHLSTWPKYDESKILNKTVKIAIQIDGKLRDVIEVDYDTPEEVVKEKAKQTEGYKKWIGEKVPKKTVVVKNKIINIVL
jgi:leucyl-tRNA synthetase